MKSISGDAGKEPRDWRGARVALALGSGAARGWAHIGVLRALDERGVKIVGVAGTSMGALVGGVYAAGRLPALAEVACALDWRRMMYYFWEASIPRSGLIDGHKIVRFIRQYVHFDDIESLATPFRAVAASIKTGGEVLLDRGDVLDAVRASISIPGMFTPVKRDGHFLVDGGIVNPLPVSIARRFDAEAVIAVDVNHFEPDAPIPPPAAADPTPPVITEISATIEKLHRRVRSHWPQWDRWRERLGGDGAPSIFEVIGNTIRIMETRITETRLAMEPPDLLIRPALADFGFMDFHRAADAIRRGYEATIIALR